MDYPQRKRHRLQGYDYGQNGAYFVTVCTKDRRQILSRIAVGRDDLGAPLAECGGTPVVGRDDLGAPRLELLPVGTYLDQIIRDTPAHYTNVSVDHYVIMPNHFHVLLFIGDGAPGSSRPTVSQIIGLWKRLTNKRAGGQLWQSSYHDHVIRDDEDYAKHRDYIAGNPARWTDDEYYAE